MQIETGTQVTLHFALCLADGQVIDSTHEREPATFVVGDGSLPDGFEQTLIGLAAGAEQRAEVPAAARRKASPSTCGAALLSSTCRA